MTTPTETKNSMRRTKRMTNVHMKPTLYKSENSPGHAFRYCNSPRTPRLIGKGNHGPVRNKGNFFLSPLFPCNFTLRGVTFKSVAHYMQCRKYSHPKLIEQILARDSPVDALAIAKGKVISNSKKRDNEETDEINNVIVELANMGAYDTYSDDWLSCREMVMHVGNYMKFTSDDSLCKALLDTGDAPIIEESDDLFWGEGKMVRNMFIHGENNAGKSLELVRKIIRERKYGEDSDLYYNNGCEDDRELEKMFSFS